MERGKDGLWPSFLFAGAHVGAGGRRVRELHFDLRPSGAPRSERTAAPVRGGQALLLPGHHQRYIRRGMAGGEAGVARVRA